MAVDYQKVFTITGSYVDKAFDYYALIATFAADQAAIEGVLDGEDEVRLVDGLPEVYNELKDSAVDMVEEIIDRVTGVLTDELLIGENLALGTNASLNSVLPALITDMVLEGEDVKPSAISVGAIAYTTTNTTVGKLVTGTLLDGVTPPVSGGLSLPEYAGKTSQMAPDSEVFEFTCISDSETGGVRGSEVFLITGTLGESGPFSVTGENIGTPGTLTVADSQASAWMANPNFDEWEGSPESPVGWTVVTGTAGTEFQKGVTATETLYGSGNSLKSVANSGAFRLEQLLNPDFFPRRRSFFLTVWGRKVTDTDDDIIFSVTLEHDAGIIANVTAQPSTTDWTLFSTQFVVPAEITGDLVLSIEGDNSFLDNSLLDQLVIVPCTYVGGVAFALFGGPQKFLSGDKATLSVSNDNDGKFQTFFRKAYRVQLPTDATPTISDALVT